MGGLADVSGVLNFFAGMNQRDNLRDLNAGLENGTIDPNTALSKMADITGNQQDVMAASAQRGINVAQGFNPDGTSKDMTLDNNADPSLPWSTNAPASSRQQTLPQFELGQAEQTGNPALYEAARQHQVISDYLKSAPNGQNPLATMAGSAMAQAQLTGDPSGLAKLPQMLAENAKAWAETNKNNAAAAKDQSQTNLNPQGQNITQGMLDSDKEFAPVWNTFSKGGGNANVGVANNVIDSVIAQLKSGQVVTGRPVDKSALDDEGNPTFVGRQLDTDTVNARSKIAQAVLPLLKPLFGSRVTNYDAQSAMNSMGLNPMFSKEENIQQLLNLKQRMAAAQGDLNASGAYFDKNGTLSGYDSQGAPNYNTPQAPAGSMTSAPQAGGQAPAGGSAPAAAPAQGQAQPQAPAKVMTQADIAYTAHRSGKSADEVMKAAQARGYTIQ